MGALFPIAGIEFATPYNAGVNRTMRRRTVIEILFMIGFLAFGQIAAASDSCHINENGNVTIEDLISIIRQKGCDIRTIDGLIASLPESVRDRFTLFYKSESLQGPHFSDYLHPRAILATDYADKQLLFSFGGQSEDFTFLHFEVLEIDRHRGELSKDAFKFYDIQFPDEKKTTGDSWDDIQSQIRVSNANPPECVVCHGQPAKPIYQGYPIWLGSYGSLLFHPVSDEAQGLRDFLTDVAKTPKSRYRNLIFYDAKDPEPYGDTLRGKRNESFNGLLAEVNGLRVGALIQSTEGYRDFKFAIAGAFLDCDDFQSFMPREKFDAIEKNIDRGFLLRSRYNDKTVKLALKPFFKDGHSQFGDIFSIGTLPSDSDSQAEPTFSQFLERLKKYYGSGGLFRLAVDTFVKQGRQRTAANAVKVRFVTEGRGIQINDWFLDLMQPTYRTQDGVGGKQMIWPLLRNDSEFTELLAPILSKLDKGPNSNESKVLKATMCSILKKNSLHRLRNVSVPEIPAPAHRDHRDHVSSFDRLCSRCHVDYKDQIAPHIPFQSERSFSEWLKSTGMKNEVIRRLTTPLENERMPPNRVLTDEELRGLLEYLQSVGP